jgi:hypothetical protein
MERRGNFNSQARYINKKLIEMDANAQGGSEFGLRIPGGRV